IVAIANHFIVKANQELGKDIKGVSGSAGNITASFLAGECPGVTERDQNSGSVCRKCPDCSRRPAFRHLPACRGIPTV
ncbi:MAG: hypothetical protein PHV82_13465, partial [Victivallaceae bacterium]|nr:hypothetical protein [Victivallaceae bacterium]